MTPRRLLPLLVLVLAACAPAPAAPARTVDTTPATAGATLDEAFSAYLATLSVPDPGDPTWRLLGRTDCAALDRGLGFEVVSRPASDAVSERDAQSVALAAVYAYCPQFKGLTQ